MPSARWYGLIESELRFAAPVGQTKMKLLCTARSTAPTRKIDFDFPGGGKLLAAQFAKGCNNG